MNTGLIVVADNIRSLENIGALFRLADGVGAQKIILVGISGYPDRGDQDTRRPWLRYKQHARIAKTALSGMDAVPFEYYPTAADAVSALKNEGATVVCVEQDERAVDLFSDYSIVSPCCVVVGNELTGVSKEFLDAADSIVQIPMHGIGKSLNVAVAAGIACYELMRKCRLGWISSGQNFTH